MLTYYLGAGASAKALPIVDGFFTKDFVEFIKRPPIEIYRTASHSYRNTLARIEKSIDLSNGFWSIDTYAKYNFATLHEYNFIKLLIEKYLLNQEWQNVILP